MAVNSSIGYVGLKKQSAKGSAEATASFIFGVTGGGVPEVERTLNEDTVSTGNRYKTDPYIESVVPNVTVETRAYTGSLGLFLLGALGSVSTTGTGDPYSHAFSTGPLPYFSYFASEGASDALRTSVQDVKFSDVTLSWDGPKALTLAASGMGTTMDATAGAFTSGATDERGAANFFYPVGGTLQLDAVGASPADVQVKSGSVKFTNEMQAVPNSAQITPGDIFEGVSTVEFELVVIPATNYADWIEILTGSTTGSAPTGDPQFGSVNLVFQEAGAGTHTLTIAASRVAWEATLPPIDPSAGPGEITFSGIARYNATNSDAVDVTLTSATATF